VATIVYKTGIGLTTGFIGSHTVTHNYSVHTLTAHYSSLQHSPSLLTVSSLAACLPIPDSAITPRLTDARPEYSIFCILKTRSLQLTRLDCRFTVDSRLGNSARTPRLNYTTTTAPAAAPLSYIAAADPLLGSRDVYRARVRHTVYVTSAILFTSHSIVDCCLAAIATVVHNRHIAYSMHVIILNNIGDKGHPCRTPLFISREVLPFTLHFPYNYGCILVHTSNCSY
jgi:hypothetical protein